LKFYPGNFPPCSVCQRCNEVFQNKSRKYSRDQKLIVLYFRRFVIYFDLFYFILFYFTVFYLLLKMRLHLQQQARERDVLDERRELALEKKLKNGQPKYGFIFGDAMTSYKGDTIKDGFGVQPFNTESTIMNRVFAMEIASGPVHFTAYFSNDQTLEKGANLTGTFIFILHSISNLYNCISLFT